MKLIISVKVDEGVYRKAVTDGWNRCNDEDLTPDDITTLIHKDDFIRAIGELNPDEFELVVTYV